MSERHCLYEFGPFRLDAAGRRLLRDGRPLPLTAKAFDILLILVEHQGRIVAKEELMEKVWPDVTVRESTLAQNIFTLRKLLGDDAAENQYIETVPKYGYRFIAEARAVASGVAPLAEEPTGLTEEIRPASAGLKMAVMIACALLAALAIGFWLWTSGRKPSATGARALAVLPFRPVAADNRDELLEFGMADSLITRLSNVNQLVVRPMGSVRKYAGPEQDPVAAGRQLRADLVLEGGLQRKDDRIHVTARLVQVSDGQSLWSDTFNEKATDIFRLQDALTEQIAEALLLKLTGEEKRLLARRYTENDEAYRLYQRGLYFWNLRTEEGYYKAIEQFRQAIETDPNYALAYAGLADTYHLLGDYSYLPPQEAFPRATDAAATALKIDDTLAEAHTSLAYAKFLYDWDWAAAEREFRRALELSPAYTTALQWQGEYLVGMGRFDEARESIRRARDIDPTSRILSAAEGWIAYIARDYDRAIEQCQQALELEASFYPAHFWRGQAYEKKGMYREALAAYERASAFSGRSPEVLASLGRAYALAGDRAAARKILDELTALSGRGYVSPYFFALLYEGLRDKDKAFEWLTKACAGRSRSMPFLKVDPMLDGLRPDPRFAELLRCVGLTP